MSDENVVHLFGPADDDWDRLGAAHEQEGLRNGAEFGNFGWVTGEDSITSKTSRGYLTSVMCRATGKVQHHWEIYRPIEPFVVTLDPEK